MTGAVNLFEVFQHWSSAMHTPRWKSEVDTLILIWLLRRDSDAFITCYSRTAPGFDRGAWARRPGWLPLDVHCCRNLTQTTAGPILSHLCIHVERLECLQAQISNYYLSSSPVYCAFQIILPSFFSVRTWYVLYFLPSGFEQISLFRIPGSSRNSTLYALKLHPLCYWALKICILIARRLESLCPEWNRRPWRFTKNRASAYTDQRWMGQAPPW